MFAEIQLIDEDSVGPIDTAEGWVFSNWKNQWKTTCGGFPIFGGYNVFDSRNIIFKTFDVLPPNYQIIIRFKFWRQCEVDQIWLQPQCIIQRSQNWDINYEFTIYVDNVLVHRYKNTNIDSSTNISEPSYQDFVIPFDLAVDHFSTSSTILMTTRWWMVGYF